MRPATGTDPGAVNLDVQELLAPLRTRSRLGRPTTRNVTYCHSRLASELAASSSAPPVPRLELPRLLARVVARRVAPGRDRLERPVGRSAGGPSPTLPMQLGCYLAATPF